jgi:Holliday junction resolvase-like predicted endonuclease
MTDNHFSSWHVGVAAEAIAAALFARCGLDVSVQYGANQPEYDLIVVNGEKLLKISVKGSKDGCWGLTQSHVKKADYHGAIDIWSRRHKRGTILCFVQFKSVSIDQLPRVYLATPAEVARRLRETAKGRGDTVLYERHTWAPRASAAGTSENIPEHWKFSVARVEGLLESES